MAQAMGGDVPQTEVFRQGMGRSSSNNAGPPLGLVEEGEWVANHTPFKFMHYKGVGGGGGGVTVFV